MGTRTGFAYGMQMGCVITRSGELAPDTDGMVAGAAMLPAVAQCAAYKTPQLDPLTEAAGELESVTVVVKHVASVST